MGAHAATPLQTLFLQLILRLYVAIVLIKPEACSCEQASSFALVVSSLNYLWTSQTLHSACVAAEVGFSVAGVAVLQMLQQKHTTECRVLWPHCFFVVSTLVA